MTRHLIVIALAAIAVGRAADATAQPRWGFGRIPQDGACFYEDRDFQGRYFCASAGDTLTTLPDRMGEHISSIRIIGETEVTVFRDKNLRGRWQQFAGSITSLRGSGWNDRISSLALRRPRWTATMDEHREDRGDTERRGGNPWPNDTAGDREYERREDYRAPANTPLPAWGRGEIPRQGACFYEERDFRGRYFCLPRGGTFASLPAGFNDRISSIKVFSTDVTIFGDRDYRGRSRRLRRDVADLRGDWSNTISSIRVD